MMTLDFRGDVITPPKQRDTTAGSVTFPEVLLGSGPAFYLGPVLGLTFGH